MTADPFDPGPAAAILAGAWRSGRQLAELPLEVRPRSMAQGYDVQDRLIAELGEEAAGWKLGVGSQKLKQQSGVGRSIAGRILASHRHAADATVLLPNAAPVTVEFEIAFVLGRDVLPDGPGTDPWDVVAETRVTFELVLSRFVDRRAVGWPSFAADNAGFEALVVGPPIDPGALPGLAASLVVSVNGDEKARAATGEDATDPIAALGDLLAIARERRMVLPRGSIVSTGSASVPFNLAKPQAEIVARFGETELGFRTIVAPRDAASTLKETGHAG